MSNRKEILITKYLEFKNNLDNIGFNTKLFPSLEDIDVVDLLMFFNLCFAFTTEYEPTIRNLATSYNLEITEEEYAKGMPLITEYIDWLKLFQKSC
jgi:hypothetical protein